MAHRNELIRWHLVVLGAIDGFSRLRVVLSCCNNKAIKLLEFLPRAVDKFGLPSRVRSDIGSRYEGGGHFKKVH